MGFKSFNLVLSYYSFIYCFMILYKYVFINYLNINMRLVRKF